MRLPRIVVAMAAIALATPAFTARAQDSTRSRPPRTFLAIGAHAGDMEIAAGALLLKQHELGDRVVILHLTLGEGGNPRMSPEQYGEQKRREAKEAAAALGVEVIFGPYHDGEIPNDEAARRYVADVIRQVQPTNIITHWRRSIHKDHAATSAIVDDAVLLASLDGVKTAHPAYRGIRGIWYTENWEDPEGFDPYIYVDVSGFIPRWREAVSKYEFIRGGISSFRYLDYYTALATLRGAESRREAAVAFDIDDMGKRRVLDSVP
ncbi:MAG TPA: PIG-L family deacetylase [Gemmatimonadaceae bacterium]|nr:PIG-L family deacetylase [Gemmatimonadaceae bacterium]